MRIKKVLKAYFEKRQEKEHVKKQRVFEDACVEYFNKYITHITNIEKLKDNIPIGRKGLPLLVKSDSNSYPLQAVKACIPFEDDNIQLYYGDYPYLHTPE